VFRIDARVGPAEREIHFLSATGRLYTLYFTDAAAAPVWQTVPGQTRVPGLGAPQILRDTNPAPPFRLYRLGVEPP
jgi:hypothetical protein